MLQCGAREPTLTGYGTMASLSKCPNHFKVHYIDRWTHELEVETMAKSKADVLIEPGVEQGIEHGKTQAKPEIEDVLSEQFKIQMKQEEVIKLIKNKFDCVSPDITEKVTSIHNISTLAYLSAKVMITETLDEIDWEEFNSESPKFVYIQQ